MQYMPITTNVPKTRTVAPLADSPNLCQVLSQAIGFISDVFCVLLRCFSLHVSTHCSALFLNVCVYLAMFHIIGLFASVSVCTNCLCLVGIVVEVFENAGVRSSWQMPVVSSGMPQYGNGS